MQKIQLKTVSTIDAVRDMLEQDIYSLYFPPGSKITENDLVLRYGISRNTLREAIAYLQVNGLLIKVPNKGVFVKKISSEDIREIFNLRAVLEHEAIREVVASGKNLESLKQNAIEVENQNALNDWYGSMVADIQFHESLVHLTENQRLVQLYNCILSEVKLCIFQSGEFSTIRKENAEQHFLIIDCMERKNADMAREILSLHIHSAINNFILGFSQKENP